MGLFTRNRPAPADAAYWFTQEAEPFVAAAEDMDDDGCLSDAHGAQFYLAPEAAACLTIWAYAAPCGQEPDDGFFVGFCIEYQAGHPSDDSYWVAKLYHGDEFPEWYPDAAQAEMAARATAIDILNNQAKAIPIHASQEAIADWFDWDGLPFTAEA